MGFRYPLQKIVDLKAGEKSQAEWELSRSVGRLFNEQEELRTLQAEQMRVRERLLAAAASRASVSDLLEWHRYADYLDERIQRKQADVADAARQVADDRGHLNDRVKDEKVWNRARDKAFGIYALEQGKAEQAAVDEIAISRYKRH